MSPAFPCPGCVTLGGPCQRSVSPPHCPGILLPWHLHRPPRLAWYTHKSQLNYKHPKRKHPSYRNPASKHGSIKVLVILQSNFLHESLVAFSPQQKLCASVSLSIAFTTDQLCLRGNSFLHRAGPPLGHHGYQPSQAHRRGQWCLQ